MRLLPPLLSALVLHAAPLSATEQIITLGDSLSFAYEAEFCFRQTFTGIGTFGDGFDSRTRNWVEILGAYRPNQFDLGTRDSVIVDPPADPPFTLYFRQSQNWAIPGLKADGLRRFLIGEATFTQLIGNEFSTLGTILAASDYAPSDFAVSDLQSQIASGTVERLTLCIGGNDIKEVYGSIYNGNSAGTFVVDFMADITAILNWVQALNPNIQIVLVNVPHVGITPDVRVSYPYEVSKTERVSAVLRDLNSQLATLAASRGIGYADIYTPTIRLINGTTGLCIHGVNYGNQGTTTGNLGPAFLNGPISRNFHPNTNAQALIANEIVYAFNKRYNSKIAPLTATEIVVNLTEKTPEQADVTFTDWITRHGIIGGSTSDDSDGDGIPAGVEFAMGLNPARYDSDRAGSGIAANSLEIAYPVRLPSSTQYTVTPESSSTLTGAFTPFATLPSPEIDGLCHARLPLGSARGFLRLKAVIAP